MEDKSDIGIQDNPVPFWIKIMWGIFAIWGLAYLTIYWLPDLNHWIHSTDPDSSQWREYGN